MRKVLDFLSRPAGFSGVLLIAAGILVGSFLPTFIGPSRAQLSAIQTYVPSGSISYNSGTNTYSFTLANVLALNDLLGVPIRIVPPSANAAGGTNVNISGLGSVTIQRNSLGSFVAIAGGDMAANGLAELIYNGTVFVEVNPAGGGDPVGSEKFFAANISTPAGYLVENGTCVSQTTYAALYAFFGSSDIWSPGSTGAACSAGNFHLPYSNGSALAAFDTQGGVTAGKLTTAGSSCNGAGAVNCGAQNQTIAQAALPNVTLAVSIGANQGSHSHSTPSNYLTGGAGAGIGGTSSSSAGQNNGTNPATLPAMSGTTASINGGVSQATVPTLQPTRTTFIAIRY